MTVLALLDKPHRSSFGIVPVAWQHQERVKIAGLHSASVHRAARFTHADLDDLIKAGHALRIERSAERIDSGTQIESGTVALWVGAEFESLAQSLGLSPAPLPEEQQGAAGGRFFLGPASLMHPYLAEWTSLAFREFRKSSRQDQRAIASLMRWVLPGRPETLAASWASAENKDRELQLQLRSYERTHEEAQLQRRHESLLEESEDPRAVARFVCFAGLSGGDRSKVATRFADAFALSHTSFGTRFEQPFVESARERKLRQMHEGESAVVLSPLAVVLDVLNALKQMDHKTRDHVVVIDGVRHQKVRETFAWLQPEKVLVVGVKTDQERRRRRLLSRQLDVEEIDRHSTEVEIPMLIENADFRIGSDPDPSELQRIFDLAIG